MENKSVLFVGHEATRSGAPIALLHFMRWFKSEIGWPFSCLLQNGGELVQEYASLCPTAVLTEGIWHERSVMHRVFCRVGLGKLTRWVHSKSLMQGQIVKPDLIYCNTIAGLGALEYAVNYGERVLCHVHELEFSFRAGVGPVRSQRVLDLSDHFIACSRAVANNLMERHGVSEDTIDVVHESIATDEAAHFRKDDARQWLHGKLNISEDTFLVGAAGELSWRKGSDLFVQVAAVARQMRPDLKLHFLWLGGQPNSRSSNEFMHDVELCDLTSQVSLISSQPDPLRYFSGLDLFLLPSREDPYPLVCLEAAACGIPIVCFSQAGGMPEFIEEDCGKVVPYLNVSAMATQVIKLMENVQQRKCLGNSAYQKVRARNDISVAAPKIFSAMLRTMESQ